MSVLKNKQRLLHLYRYLMENTDEEHQATTNDLVSFLRQEDANASRKTVKDDIEVLIEEGADIVTTKSYYNSYFIGSRMLEIPEVKMLIAQHPSGEGSQKGDCLLRYRRERIVLLQYRQDHGSDQGEQEARVPVF